MILAPSQRCDASGCIGDDGRFGPKGEQVRRWRTLRGVSIALPAALAVLLVAAGAQAATIGSETAPGQPRTPSADVTDKVIIVFRDQVPAIPDTPADAATRAGRVRSVQRGVLSQLAATHARDVKSLTLVNAVAATVSPAEVQRLRANGAVREVVPDLPIPVAAGTSPTQPRASQARAGGITPLPGACAPDGHVQLDPQAIESIQAATPSGRGESAQALGYTGAGVKVAFIADDLDIDNPDFIRANGQHVFVDYQDFSGSGTSSPGDGAEAFLDASSIAAQGRHVYDVADYGTALDEPCNIRILGVAPGASLVGLDVVADTGVTYLAVFLEAVNYAVTVDHVNVINESFGVNPFPDSEDLNLMDQANDAAVKAGVTVTVASGDAGPTNTIASPASDPNVISAGATTTYRSYAQTGINGITDPLVKGWLNNNISGLSSGGFDQAGGTVDVVAPGDLNWALCTPSHQYSACTSLAGKLSPVELSGGTSEAAPLTAGVAALVIQAYAQAHHGQDPSPALVKQIIVSTAQDIDAPAQLQGAGMIDAYQAVLAARSYPGGTRAPRGNAILDSATQLNRVGRPGGSQTMSDTLTNDGAAPQVIGLTTRTLGAYHAVLTRKLSLRASRSFGDTVRFNVPPGQARLNVSVALQAGVYISLIAPDGDFAEYNSPQGYAFYGNAQVAGPAAGKWTALVTGIPESTGDALAALFQASTASWQPFGSLSARWLTLPPGASRTVTLRVRAPSEPGDEAGSILVRGVSFDRRIGRPEVVATTSIPVTLRALAPTPRPSVTFSGTLTGGNGRSFATGQTSYYQFEMPAGDAALNADIDIGNPDTSYLAELVGPDGEAASTAFNQLVRLSQYGEPSYKQERGAQLHVLRPGAGLWTLIIDFFGSVPGTAISAPYTVTLTDQPVAVSATGLPDSTRTVLARGKAVTAYLHVTNNGSATEAYFVDARLAKVVRTDLVEQVTSYLVLPNTAGLTPAFFVPAETTSVTATVSASKRLYFDLGYAFGDPDVISSTGTTATATLSAPQVPTGLWTVAPYLAGPTGSEPAKTVNSLVTMTAITRPIDPAITASSGDLWSMSVNPVIAFSPYIVAPGHSLTIPVTIKPNGAPGSTVTGTLYLDDSSGTPALPAVYGQFSNAPAGSAVAAFSYRYKIG
jgi:Subtilase family